jgi:hypothetical protein
MKFVEVKNIETGNTELVNLANVTNITKIIGGYKDRNNMTEYADIPYHGYISFLYGGAYIRISAEDYERLRHL